MDRGAWRAIVHEEKDPQNFRRLAQSHSMLGRAVRASGFPGGAGGMKNLPANARDTEDVGSVPGLGDSLEQKMATTPVFLSRKFHG